MLGGHARPRQSVERSRRRSSRHRLTSKWKRPSCPTWHGKLNFQQLENALGTPLPAAIKGYATLRDAKLAESNYDKVVTTSCGRWCGWIALRCDREQVDKAERTVPTYFTDLVVDAPTIVPGSEIWTLPSMDRPLRNEILDALQEDADFCEDGETTIARDGAIAIPGVFCFSADGQEAIEENEVPADIIARPKSFPTSLGTGLSERISMLRRSPEVSSVPDGVQVAEIWGPRMRRSSIQQLKLRTRCATCRKLGHWARECPEGNRGQTQRRKVRSTCNET